MIPNSVIVIPKSVAFSTNAMKNGSLGVHLQIVQDGTGEITVGLQLSPNNSCLLGVTLGFYINFQLQYAATQNCYTDY